MSVRVTALLHAAFLCGAFWTALLRYRGARPPRFVAGLGAGAVFSHAGWATLHWTAVSRNPTALLDPSLGYCVLFFPLGPLLLAPGPATWRALPLALVVARLGCAASACCGGAPAPWGAHPTPLYEAALLVALHFTVRAGPDARAVGVFLTGFGLERLLVEPWRLPPPLGQTEPDPALLAALWCAAGAATLLAPRARRAATTLHRTEAPECERPCSS